MWAFSGYDALTLTDFFVFEILSATPPATRHKSRKECEPTETTTVPHTTCNTKPRIFIVKFVVKVHYSRPVFFYVKRQYSSLGPLHFNAVHIRTGPKQQPYKLGMGTSALLKFLCKWFWTFYTYIISA